MEILAIKNGYDLSLEFVDALCFWHRFLVVTSSLPPNSNKLYIFDSLIVQYFEVRVL